MVRMNLDRDGMREKGVTNDTRELCEAACEEDEGALVEAPGFGTRGFALRSRPPSF